MSVNARSQQADSSDSPDSFDAERGPSRPWRADFRSVWAGETVSLIGSQVFQLCLPLTAVLVLKASPGQLGVLGALVYAPWLVLGLVAGWLVDRWQRRAVLIISDLGQSVAVGAIPILAVLGRLSFGWLLGLAGLAGVFRVFFTVAYRSYLPQIVPSAHLAMANSRLTASESVAEIGGPGLGGVLALIVGAPFALAADSVSYLFSAAGFARVRRREVPAAPADGSALSHIAEGFRFSFGNAYLRAFVGEAASYNLFWQMAQTVLALFAVTQMGMSAGMLGVTLAIGAVGALAGSAVTVPAAHRLGLNRTLIGSAVIGDLAPLALPAAQRGMWAVPLFAAAFLVQGFGITACNVHVMTVRQTLTPPHLLGRANAAYMFVAQGVKPVGALLGGWLGTLAGPRTALAVAALGLLSTSLFLVFSPLRRIKDLDDITAPPLRRWSSGGDSRRISGR
ncbi:MFS transporter [Catenulispora acidiphila]|uniref:MFS transporter n=1 Tax=Catenulispora acidiphila TaxID=304895 RepID=UPI00117C2397|nr:MFS transporter [Catenulispora acidiphila]